MLSFYVNEQIEIGSQLVFIAGPCVIENRELCVETAAFLKDISIQLKIPYIFKASFDKANRTSGNSFRGPGLESGLKILSDIKRKFDIPVVTDIHEAGQVEQAAKIVDILQIPAFLCRQTDLLLAAGQSGKVVNIKKGQFMSPENMKEAVDKVKSTGNKRVMLTERGTSFGYNNLIVDMRSLVIMRGMGVPVVFDATHSVQLPGGLGESSGGQRHFVATLACAAAAAGIDALFLEVHPRPDKALSDGPNSVNFETAFQIISSVKEIYELKKKITKRP